jgi:predicted transposase YbfD/YdcC
MLCIVKKTLDTIEATNNHYVVAVKRNSKNLFHLFESSTGRLTKCISYHKTVEICHGRKETRIIHVFESTNEIREYLSDIKTVVRIERFRENKMSTTHEIVYYACNDHHNAKKFNIGIRGYWEIENRLHWVKDVVMLEDKSPNGNRKIAPIISLLKSHVIGLSYLNSNNVINFQRTLAHNIEFMSLLLE